MTAPGPMAVPPTWSCTACTTTNDPKAAFCVVCGTTRAAAPPSRVPQATVVAGGGAPVATTLPAPVGSGPTPPAPAGGTPRRDRTALLALASTAVAVVLLIALVVVVDPFGGSDGGDQVADGDETPTLPTATTEAGGGGVPQPTEARLATTTTTAPRATTTIAAEVAATFELQELRAQGRARVDAVATERWIPQLSSKRIGLVVDGVVYDDAAIVADYSALVAAHPGVEIVLLWSADFSTFKDPTYWVTVALVPASDAAGANAWCDREGIGVDDCFAKLLSHVQGHQGATESRK